MMILLLVGVAVLAIIMGILVWARRPEGKVNRSFLGFSIALSSWVITNALYVVITDSSLQYIIALLSYMAAGFVATYFLYFAMTLTFRTRFVTHAFVVGVLLATASGMPGLLATGVRESAIQTTPVIVVYAAFIVTYLLGGATILFTSRKLVLARRKQQIDTVFIGTTAAMIGGAVCNLLLPILGNYSFVAFGPACSLIFVYFFAYSIIRHHMFDIRRAFARVVAYGLAVIFLGIGFGILAGVTADILLIPEEAYKYVFITASVMIAILYAPTKQLFDKITKNVFYRSEYDIQNAIDQMTEVFVKARTSKYLISRSSKALSSILRAEQVLITEEIEPELASYIKHDKLDIVFQEDVEEKESNQSALISFDKNAIAIIAVLKVEGRQTGYLVIGRRANGTSYSRHDHEFLEILKDELAIALENVRRLERIEGFTEDLKVKVQDATSELRNTNRKLRLLDESKDEFISMASHQLRTPLTSVKGYISMVLDGDMGEITPQQRKVLEEAFTSSQRMVYLIGDFLNVSRLQTGKFELELASVKLPFIIKQEISQLKATAGSRGITLAYTPPENFPQIVVDENKMRQVMMNFIDNAIYYSPADTTITISLVKHPHHVTFKVIDQGIGVPKSEQHKLFSKFYRASNAKQQRPDGTGIGLFMAKKVIVAHGGSIIFETSEGKGSTFGFRLPLGAQDQAAMPTSS